jgi:hypothetical protein
MGDTAGWGVAKIELPEGWAGVAEPLRALMAEVDRAAHADSATPPDLAAVSARWARVSDAIRATVRARIADAQVRAPKR